MARRQKCCSTGHRARDGEEQARRLRPREPLLAGEDGQPAREHRDGRLQHGRDRGRREHEPNDEADHVDVHGHAEQRQAAPVAPRGPAAREAAGALVAARDDRHARHGQHLAVKREDERLDAVVERLLAEDVPAAEEEVDEDLRDVHAGLLAAAAERRHRLL